MAGTIHMPPTGLSGPRGLSQHPPTQNNIRQAQLLARATHGDSPCHALAPCF